MPGILLVAPDSDLRKSLEFALRMEGYEVTSRASIGAREQPGAYDCTVIDHHALGNNKNVAADFCRLFAPAILLTNHQDHPLSPWTFRTLLKPLLGAALIDAVRDAVAVRASAK
jgi:hypothetical protein